MSRKQLRHDAQMRACLTALGLSGDGRQFRFDGEHADAGESAFLLQELQAIEQKLYDTPFGLRKSDILIPMAMDVPAGAQEWGYDRVTPYGLAQWLSADAKDFARADVQRKRVTFPIQDMGISYSYTRKDLLAAMMANMPLDSMQATAARRGIDAFRDKVLLEGDSTVGFSGFINDPSVTIGNVSHGTWDGSGATPDQAIAEINTDVYTVGATCREIYWPDTLVVPAASYAWLTTTPRSSTSDTTIWEYIVKNNPYLKNLEMLLQLGPTSDTGGIGPGVAGVGRAIYYKRDPEVVVAKMAIMFEQLAPQMRGMSVEVPCWSRMGGTHWRVPIAAMYKDGVR